MYTLPSDRVRFGAFELDLSTGELRSIEAPDPSNKVILREQVFQVLRMLVEREGKIVTREEIKTRLWANDTVVDFDHSINATIKPWGIPPIALGTSRPWRGVAIA
jgi:DNA-binding winged helix-turn-helix (wHTH) protein